MKHSLAVLFFAVPLMAQFGGARRVTPQGATLPAKCATGDLFQKTGASAGLYNCSGPDTWVAAAGGSGTTLPSQTGNSGKFLTTDGTSAAWAAVLAAPYALDITAGETVNLDHNYNTRDAKAVCVAAASPYAEIFPGAVEYPSVNRITLTFSPAFTGRCAVFSSVAGAGGGGGGSGTVTSVGLTAPSEISVSGSPVTASGSFTLAWASQAANKFLASPDGSSGAMSARAIVNGDLPIVSIAKGGTGGQTASAARVALLPSLSGNASKCLAANSGATDVEWATCASGGGSSSPTLIAFAGETDRTVTAATHGLGTTPVFLGCRRTSDGVWASGVAYTTNTSGDVTINPAAGSAYTGSCYIGGPPSGSLVLIDPAIVPTRISAPASLSYSTFSGTGNCEEQSITLAGAAVGDVVDVGLPTAFPAGIIVGAKYVSAANTVTLRLCRLAGTNTISGQTFTAQIVRSF